MTQVSDNALPRPSAPRANVPALLSLTTGAISCVPFIGIFTVVLAILGLQRAKELGSRGMAIAGLVLGLLGVAWTAVLLLGIIPYARESWVASSPARRSAETFMIDLSKGRLDDAMMRTGESIDRPKLDTIYDRLEPLGEFKGLSFGTSRLTKEGGNESFLGRGTLVFDRGEPAFEIVLVRKGGMMYVDRVQVDEPKHIRKTSSTKPGPATTGS